MAEMFKSTHGVIEFHRCHVEGGDVVISLENSDAVLRDSSFIGCNTVVKGIGQTSIDAQNVVHVEGKRDSGAIPLDILRRMCNVNV